MTQQDANEIMRPVRARRTPVKLSLKSHLTSAIDLLVKAFDDNSTGAAMNARRQIEEVGIKLSDLAEEAETDSSLANLQQVVRGLVGIVSCSAELNISNMSPGVKQKVLSGIEKDHCLLQLLEISDVEDRSDQATSLLEAVEHDLKKLDARNEDGPLLAPLWENLESIRKVLGDLKSDWNHTASVMLQNKPVFPC